VYRKYKTSAEISAGGKEYTKDVGSDNSHIYANHSNSGSNPAALHI
jgi:hypothetical protein